MTWMAVRVILMGQLSDGSMSVFHEDCRAVVPDHLQLQPVSPCCRYRTAVTMEVPSSNASFKLESFLPRFSNDTIMLLLTEICRTSIASTFTFPTSHIPS